MTSNDITPGGGENPAGGTRPACAQAFLADKRDLPVFGALTREMGWLGLHMPPAARAAAETEAR